MTGIALRSGVDLVHVDTVAAMLASSGPEFSDMCWTAAEQSYCNGSAERLATRLAAKEATMKALKTGIGVIAPVDVEVIAIEGQAPELRLHGNAQAQAHAQGISGWSLSLSHEHGWALAFVVALETTP
jgi:holo-[acyl-carrier protein] synthase